MCTQCDDDGEIMYEFPCLNFTETLPGLWEREGPYKDDAVYGGYRLRSLGNDQLLACVFSRIQVGVVLNFLIKFISLFAT